MFFRIQNPAFVSGVPMGVPVLNLTLNSDAGCWGMRFKYVLGAVACA